MDALVPLQFRPTAIIFVGPTGDITRHQKGTPASGTTQGQGTAPTQQPLASVYEHFCDLCTKLDPVLYQGIGLLAIDEGSNDTTTRSIETVPNSSATRSGDFLMLLSEVLHTIREYRGYYEIKDAGYPMPMKHPQIYIVGQIDSIWVSKVAEWVNTLLGHDRTLALISYVLIEGPVLAGQAVAASLSPPQWTGDLVSQGGLMPLVNFCYIYEEMGQHLLYMKEPDMRYAVAEVLFGFLATGITASPSFKEATELSLMISNADARIGSMGTSLITFPRVSVESYCADMHGVELVNNWISAMQRRDLDEKQQKELSAKMREQAQIDAQRICDNMSDNGPRPSFAERLWPSLSFLEDDYLTQQLKEATENIFQNFLSLKEWEVDPKRRETQAMQAFRAWKDVAEGTWVVARHIMEQEMSGKVDTIWLHNEQGTNAAKTYAGQLDVVLGQVRDRFMKWRVKHKETYEESLLALQECGQGPWVIRSGASNLISGQGAGPTQAAPNATNLSPIGMVGPPPTLNSPPGAAPVPPLAVPPATSPGTQSQQPSQRGGLLDREKEIVKNLADRFEWLRERVPKVANLVAVGVMATPPLVLLALTLLPPSWLASPLLTAFATLVGAGLCAAGSWFYYEQSKHRVRDAEEDLLRAYRLYFAYQCEWWEDQLRIVVLGPLIGKVRRMRAQLENFEAYLRAISELLCAAAEQTEKELFDSPSGYRDVFVGDKEILSKNGHRLADFNQTIVHRRQALPKETWHQTSREIHKCLREFFAARGINIIGIQQDMLIQHIREFTHMMIVPYLQDDLVEIAAALEAEGDRGKFIIEKAMENSKVLYRPYHNIPELSYYICGRDEQRSAIPEKAIPANTTMVRTADREWMLLTCFWTGGARMRWGSGAPASPSGPSSLPSTPTW